MFVEIAARALHWSKYAIPLNKVQRDFRFKRFCFDLREFLRDTIKLRSESSLFNFYVEG